VRHFDLIIQLVRQLNTLDILKGEVKMFAHYIDAYEHGVHGDTVPKPMNVEIDVIAKMPTQ